MNMHVQIAIIGSGPGGLSAAARAARRGVAHVVLEAAPQLANTIYRYQKSKFVMAEPSRIPLRSDLVFEAGRREDILEIWHSAVENHGVQVRYAAEVVQIDNSDGVFNIGLSNGERISADKVVLAIGLQGNLRRLSVPGDDLTGVQYQLDDPLEYLHETIVVVGAGDAGVENALALAEQNRVILINWQEDFNNCKQANFELLMAAANAGKIEIRKNTVTDHIEQSKDPRFPLVFVARDENGLTPLKCHRVIARLGATPPRRLLEKFGVKFASDNVNAIPVLNDHFESSVPGMYIVGALAGYPLIKQAMNQGYDVVEHILGYAIEPADDGLLREKLLHIAQATTVSAGIEWIRNTVPIFTTLSKLQLRELLLESNIRAFADNEPVYQLNDYSNNLFAVLTGEVFLQTEDKEGGIGRFDLGEGEFFGEMELISGRPRSGTATARTSSVLIEVPRRNMLKLLGSALELCKAFDAIAMSRVIKVCLDTELPDTELDYLLEDAELRQYLPGELLFKEGDTVEGLYLIRRGSVTESRLVSGKRVVLGYVTAGNYVGEMALISGGISTVTFSAASRTEIILLKSPRVLAVMKRNASIRNKIDSLSLENISKAGAGSHSEYGDLLSFIFQQGGGEATDMLLIDHSLCIRCNHCEESCADEHEGISRLTREAGPGFQQIHIPVACRHCEHPHCAKDCPPDAIHRLTSGEVIIDERCIGCGNCQRNCPYGAIQMAALQPYRKNSFWNLLLGKRQPAALDPIPPKKAVKCDRCFGLEGGPACVRKCPTGAARRVGPEELINFGVDYR